MNFCFLWFEVHTPFKSCRFCHLNFFADAKCFCRENFLLDNFQLFSFCEMSLRTKKNVCQHSHLLVNAEPRCFRHFRSKIEVKSSKSFCRGNLLFVPFNHLFYIWTMRQCLKNILATFQSLPTFLAGFFPKEWRTTTIEGRLSSSLHVVSTAP